LWSFHTHTHTYIYKVKRGRGEGEGEGDQILKRRPYMRGRERRRRWRWIIERGGRNEEKVERWMMKELSVNVRTSFGMYDKCDVDFIGVSKDFKFFLLKLINDSYG